MKVTLNSRKVSIHLFLFVCYFTSIYIESKPLAVVYKGPAGCDDCTDAASGPLLETYDVLIAGPKEKVNLREALKLNPEIYIQPGGGDDMKIAWDDLKAFKEDIRNYVSNGGNYIGLCMGGYLAGEFNDEGISEGGFKLLEESGSYVDAYIDSDNAEFKTTDNTVLDFKWEGDSKKIFFQHGPYFSKPLDTTASIIATYKNGEIAVMIARFKKGNVAVVGPHPEATEDWYLEYDFNPQNTIGLYLDLIKKTVKNRNSSNAFSLYFSKILMMLLIIILL